MTVKNTVNTANEIHVLAYPYEGQRTQIDILHIMQSKFITNSIGVWCYFAWGGCCTGRRLCRITPPKR